MLSKTKHQVINCKTVASDLLNYVNNFPHFQSTATLKSIWTTYKHKFKMLIVLNCFYTSRVYLLGVFLYEYASR